jgi:fibronectin type 3 domain-containing protein
VGGKKRMKRAVCMLLCGLLLLQPFHGSAQGTSDILETSSLFNQNLELGGFETGGYDSDSIQPTTYNWTRQSRFIGWNVPVVNWSYKTEGSIRTSPVIGDDGTVYISSTDGNLYAISKGGELKWKKYIGAMEESPVIGNGGLLYIVSQQGVLTALDIDGNTKWQYTILNQYQPAVFTQPVIGKDGSIYIAANYKLYAISSSGTLKWTLNTGDYAVFNSPAIGLDGTIYAVYGQRLLAVSQYGVKKWEYTNGYDINTTPLVRGDGLIYFGTGGGVVTLTPKGADYGNPYNVSTAHGAMALGRDGQFYFAGYNGTLYMRSSYPYPVDQWEFHTGDAIWSAPLIDYMGTIYFVTDRGYIYAVKNDGTRKWSISLGSEIETTSSLSMGKDGTLYVGGLDGNLYAVGGKLANLQLNDFYDNNSELTGSAPANSTILVHHSSQEIGRGTTDSNGSFIVPLSVLSAGTELQVFAMDEYGNKSSETLVTVKDGTPPSLALSHDITVTSTDISGTSDVGAIIIAKKGIDIIEKTTADASGRFSIGIPAYPEGTELEISATDQAGNRTVKNVTVIKDTMAPDMPVVKDITDQSSKIIGSAESGSTVIATVDGKEIGRVAADRVTGAFSIDINIQAAGTVILLVARDYSGNTSIATKKTVLDITPPEKPVLRNVISNLTNVVTGITEGNASLEIKVDDEFIGSYTALPDGSFSIPISRQEDGKVMVIEAIDAAGNRSQTDVTISKIEGTYKSGGIYEDEVWTKENSPYIVSSNITVFPEATLIIEPGVEVRFTPNVKLTVRGSLISEGTADQKIVMSLVAPGDYYDRWGGIYVDGNTSLIKLNFAEIQSADTALKLVQYYVEQDQRTMKLENVTFSYNTSAIVGNLNYKQMIILNSTFESNEKALSVPNARISNSTFRNNRYALTSGNYEVYHSSFTGNRYAMKDIWWNPSVIEDNLFSFNENAIEGAGSSIIRYNTFENNGVGLALKGNETVVNNTFKNNSTGIRVETSTAKVENNNILDSLRTTVKYNLNIKNNWWGTLDSATIKNHIYDGYDDINLGLVNYSPVLSAEVNLAKYHDAVWPEGASVAAWSLTETVINVTLGEGFYFDIIKNYRISLDDKVIATIPPDQSGKLDYSIKDLKPDTSYIVKVEFQNNLGEWSPGISKQALTIDTTAPTWPADSKLNVVKENGTEFEIEWPDAIDTSEISRYDIYKDGYYYDSVPSDANRFLFKENIFEHTSYNVAVVARDMNHQSPQLKTSLTTGEYVPPGGIFIEVHPFTDRDEAITGKTEPNLLVNAFIYKDGKEYIEKYAYADSQGNFKVVLPFSLMKYEYELELKVSDYKNNNWVTVKVPIIDFVHPGIEDVVPVNEIDTLVRGSVVDNGSTVKVYVMKGTTNISDTITVDTTGSNSDFSLHIPIQKAGTVLTIVAEDKDGNTSYYDLTVKAAAPTSVKAESSSYNSLKTSWSAVSGASGYEVYRATSTTGTYSLVGTTTSTSFNNLGLTTNKPYYYKIRAYRTVGSTKVYSIYSTIVSAKPVPSAPTSVKAESSSYNSLKTSWSAVSGASGYEVYRATSSTGTYSYVGTTTSTSFTNGSLTTNQSYYYKIRAFTTVGTTKVYSIYSAIVSAKPIPSAPTSVKADSSSYNSIRTSWTAVSGANGYNIYRATSSTGTYSYVATTTSTNFNNTGLTTNQSYYYKIKAYSSVGTTKVYSNFSTVVNAKPIPSVPANFKVTRLSSTSIKLTWSAVSGASGYEVYRSTSSTGTYSLIKSTTSLYFTNSSLITGRTYYYKLRAYRTVGTTKVYSGWTTVNSVIP